MAEVAERLVNHGRSGLSRQRSAIQTTDAFLGRAAARLSQRVRPRSAVNFPVQTTSSPWYPQLDRSTPEPLACQPWVACLLGDRMGFAVLDAVRAAGAAVGPVLHCPQHRLLLVVVPHRDEGCPVAARTVMQHDLHCRVNGSRCGYHPCSGRYWLSPSPDGSKELTDFDTLFDQVNLLRAQRRRAAC